MSYPVTLIWSFRNRFGVLKKSIQSAHTTCPISVNFCLIDASSDDKELIKLREFCSTLLPRKIRIAESKFRSSLSEAWNLGIMLSDTRYVIFASSDVLFHNRYWFTNIQKALSAGYEYILVENHAVFALDKKIIPKIGWFDEGYGIGPHFDTDYLIRVSEGKIQFLNIPRNNSYVHGDTNSQAKMRKLKEIANRLPMHDKINEKIFKKKWQTSWKGWDKNIHPPTDISQVKRKLKEIDPHPFYTKKYKLLYKDSLTRVSQAFLKRIPIKISYRFSAK